MYIICSDDPNCDWFQMNANNIPACELFKQGCAGQLKADGSIKSFRPSSYVKKQCEECPYPTTYMPINDGN